MLSPLTSITPHPVFLMECALAGFQFHEGEAHWARLKPNDRVTLRREPGNRHDARAIAVEWQGVMLGYVPREANFAVSQMLDRGARVEGRIARLQANGEPWRRVSLELFARADPPVTTPPPRQAPDPIEVRTIPAVVAAMSPELKPAPVKSLGEYADRAMRVLIVSRDEIARRLALPPKAIVGNGRRTACLWDCIEISVDATGRDLRLAFPDVPKYQARLAADLSSPIGAYSWTLAFLPFLARLCRDLAIPGEMLRGEVGRWLHASLRATFRDHVDLGSLRRGVIEFLAPDPLARALANRVFDLPPAAAQFNWVAARSRSLALAAVERPRLLPFFRHLEEASFAPGTDPVAALRAHFGELGLAAGAWQRLERWGYEPFADFHSGGGPDEYFLKSAATVDYANLLHALDVEEPPSVLFGHLAARAVEMAADDPMPGFSAYPIWFLRALNRAVPAAPAPQDEDRLIDEFEAAVDWLLRAQPQPDANQCKAGWPWIVEQARIHVALRDAVKWRVPCEAIPLGPVTCVPITSGAELREEAKAMSNCLENYLDWCARSSAIVFSIRDSLTGKRLACFRVQRHDPSSREGPWVLKEIKARFNQPAAEGMVALAQSAIAKINSQ